MIFAPKTSAILMASAAAICMSIGCAQNVGDIDRTQPNALSKQDFKGVWYYRQTVTDVPAQIDYAFIGYTSTLEKIRWEIRENYLIAYRAYELQPGTDNTAGPVDEGRTTVIEGAGDGLEPEYYKGQPIAAFRVIGHFDIQRSYNTATGEQSNVIVENYTDRNWDKRDYMRVDWSRNYVTELFFLTDMNSVSAVNYFVQEQEGGPDAFYKEKRTITREGKKRDEIAYFDFVNKLNLNPALRDCWYYNRNCIPGEVKLRHSFYRLENAQRDYEAVIYDDQMVNKFGYFRIDREVYDRREGFTDVKRINYAMRHDMWKNDYKRDAKGNYLLDQNERRIPTPMAEREPKPILYYLSPNFPKGVRPYAQSIADDWDRAFRRAAGAAKGVSAQAIADQYGKMFILCDNPTTEDQADSCDPRDAKARYIENGDGTYTYKPYTVRNGDLRYSVLWWVDKPQAAGPLGYGPPHADPETGEIVAGTAYVYGAGVDNYAQSGLDTVQMANGDFTKEELEMGIDVQDYLTKSLRPDIDPRARLSEQNFQDLKDIKIDKDIQSKLLSTRQFKKLKHINSLPRPDRFDGNVTKHMQAMQKFRNAGWDKRLIDNELLAGLSGGKHGDLSKLTEEQLQEALGGLNPLSMRQYLGRQQNFRDLASRKNIYLAEFADNAVVSTALRFKGEKDYDKVFNAIRGEIFRGVGAHEVGHSIGLRHNFQGSYDAINFFDEYWDLRKENIKRPQSLADIYSLNTLTEAQINGNMQGYQYSSIMDYHSRFNGDWAGIGKYDEAAILFAYTFGTYDDLDATYDGPAKQEEGYVEVFTELPQAGRAMVLRYDRRRSPTQRALLENNHYGTAVQTLGGPDQLKKRELMRYSKLRGQIDAFAPDRPAEVPYMFCSDELAGALVSCNRWDLGADPMEIVKTARDNYYTYYPLTHFRRNRTYFDPIGPLNRSYRAHLTFLTVYQQWLLGNQEVDDDILNTIYILAAGMGFNTMFKTMTMPRYGVYEKNNGALEWQSYTAETFNPSAVVIGKGEGRRVRSLFDANSGYFYFSRMLESGHFWDWLGALYVAIEPVARTVAVDTAADRQAFLVPFYLLFEDELTTLFNGQITDDLRGVGPRLINGKVVNPPAFTLGNGAGFDPATGTSTTAPDFTDGDPITVTANLTQERYAALYGVAFFNELYTQHFVDQSRVFKIGHKDQIEVTDPDYMLKTFTDPKTGITYGAIARRNGASPSLAVQLIDQANGLVASGADEFRIDNVVDTINMITTIIDVFGGAD